MPNGKDIISKLRLIRTPYIGPVSYRQLLGRFGSAGAALDGLPELAVRGGGRGVTIATRAVVEKEIGSVAALGGRYLFIDEPDYPQWLLHIENAPPVLTVKGRMDLLDRPLVAMVGARNASAGACRFARTLAFDLGQRGITVMSGLARGIDTAAHVGSIDTGTVGVIAGGMDIYYPPENRELQDAIADNGLLIAEQPPHTEPRARHFPYRNRIIAGLARGTVVIEAAPKSGSLITARLAADAGREVMAIPGSPLDPRSHGCNQLIREGATLVQNASEIAELIMPLDGRMTFNASPPQPVQLSFEGESEPARRAVADLLGMNYVAVDELVRQSGGSQSVVQTVLLELELSGRLERGAGGKVRLTA
ncbi:DNA-processing protein DprA [Sphingorhabdus contaminans]|uniref:DNA-processing protein DprA n=1 Tax=Sphingorhabdus contaminans TaxID=1343899 RepID=UPI003D29712B